MSLTLFSTEGCHLCDEAVSLYNEVAISSFNVIDIAYDNELFARYGVTIPVFAYFSEDNLLIEELNWPFDITQLKHWLVKHGIN